LIERDPAHIRPTELGRRFLNDLQALFLLATGGCRMTRWPHHPDTLSRGDLERNRMREIYAEVNGPGRALTDEELSASLTATLATKPKGAGWWVFAYGSLLWNPLFPVAEMRPRR
jgi:hypothetical protein